MNRQERRKQERRARRSLGPGGAADAAALGRALATATRHHQAGRLGEAEALYRRVLKAHPGHVDTLHLMGVLRHQQGQVDEAIPLLEQAAAARPDDAAFRYNLGEALRMAGRCAEAVEHYRRAAVLEPRAADIHFNLANALIELGDTAGAIDAYHRASGLAPADAEIRLNFGNALMLAGHGEDAAGQYREALRLRPDDAAAHAGLGAALMARGQIEDAVRHYRAAVAADPEDAVAHGSLGHALLLRGDPAEAKAQIDRALALRPDLADGHYALGIYHQQQGRFAEAERCLRQAVDIEPGHAQALHALAAMEDAGDRGAEIARLETQLAADDLAIGRRTALEFALAKLYDAQDRVDDAFALYDRANARRADEIGFDPDAFDRSVDEVIATVDRSFVAQHTGYGDASEKPVFVLGMPRSGTTLVEQILASHPAVFGAGERSDMQALIASLPARLGSDAGYPRSLLAMDQALSRSLAAEHLQTLAALAPEALRVIDKTPNNFLRLAFIALIFPRARIIHSRRDALDTCVSCYFQNFMVGQEFSYDLVHLGRFYRAYQRLMAHWQAVLPLAMIDIHYEELVAQQEAVSRRLVGFCGLDWDDRCLDYHRTERTVRTASLWQVRQPIYASSVGRWRRYQRHLGPLIETLGGGSG